MAERLYLSDAYLAAFNARIVERKHLSDGRLAIVLDRTAFFPTMAGLVADRGTLNDSQVTDVFEENGEILHILPQEVWSDDVQGRLDWPRRFDMMQHHTAQHILSEAFRQVAGAETVAASLSPQVAWIDVNKQIPDAGLERVIAWANQLIATGRTVRVAMVDPAQAATLPGLPPTARNQPVRVFNIEGLRLTVCYATHVSRTSEIGLLRIPRAEKIGNGRMRVEFQCGMRVLEDFMRNDRLIARLTDALGAAPADLEQTILNLKDYATQAAEAINGLHGKMLEYECIALEAMAEPMGNVRVVSRVFPDRDLTETRQLVRLLSEKPGLVILVGTAGARTQLFFACSADVPDRDMSMLLKVAAQTLGTQGGGQPRGAESLVVNADAARVEAALAKAATLLKAKR